MTIKRILGLSACTFALILAAGCGKSDNSTAKSVVNNQNNVQSVLEQGISEAEAVNENDPDPPEQNDPVGEAVEDTQSITRESDLSPAPTSEPEADTLSGTNADFVDLTALSGTMVYSEVYNMMYAPEDYIGKSVKMSGLYSVYHDESTGRYYHACIISDATACCSQGIEFEPTDDYIYPDDYPEEGGQICVVGTFDTYQEGEYRYCTLRDAKIIEKDDVNGV